MTCNLIKIGVAMDELKLYKAYLVYNTNVVMHLCWAKDKDHVYELLGWTHEDKPEPIIQEISKKTGGILCHHIADYNLYKTLRHSDSSELA